MKGKSTLSGLILEEWGGGAAAGFTMIELMIVVAIIGILAAIAIPRFGDMIEKSREGATKGGLNSLKAANSIYYGDSSGSWPTSLEPSTSRRYSLYLDVIPEVKVTSKFIPGAPSPRGYTVSYASMGGEPAGAFTGWMYDSGAGSIYVNSTVRDSKKIPYSYYGFE